jgi:tetratricopeptide (TPR) repeat protein
MEERIRTMSNAIQDITSIAPMADMPNQAKSPDPVQADYEEGKRFLENNESAQAAVALHNALLGYEERGDEKGIANACNQLGNVCLVRKEFDKAEKHYRRALEVCEKFSDPASRAALAKKLVEVHRGSHNYDQAIAGCLDLLDVYSANNDPQGTVAILEIMAEIYLETDKPAAAADSYRTISSIHRNYKHNSIADSYAEKAAELERKM